MARYIIEILNSSLQRAAYLEDYESLSWTRRWQSAAEFTLNVSRYSSAASYLIGDNFIHIVRNGSSEYIGIIEYKDTKLDEKGKASEKMEIKGGSVLSRRICLPAAGQATDSQAGAAETVMRTFLTHNVVSPTDANRTISLVVLEANGARGNTITIDARYAPLLDVLSEAAIAGNIGYELIKSGSSLAFHIIPGVDRSTNQAVVAPVIFSPDFGNIQTQEHLWSVLGSVNFAYVGGKGEGAARVIQAVGTANGLSRRETFIDASDLDTTAKLTQRGQTTINEQGPEEKLEATILPYGPFSYRDDWDLGDIATIRNLDWGILAHLRISEVTVALERGKDEDISVAFGAPWPNFIQHYKRTIRSTGPSQRK